MTKKLIAFVTVFALLFSACKKDEEEEIPQPVPTPTPTELTANTLIVNGVSYSLQSSYRIDQNGRGYLDAQTIEVDEESNALYFIVADVETGSLNGTYDLTAGNSDYYFNVRRGDDSFGISQDCHGDVINAWIGDVDYPSGIFTSGTLSTTKDDNLFTYKVNGTLVNGQTVGFYISVPAAEWEYLEW